MKTMKTTASLVGLAAALLIGANTAHAAIGALDNVPAATLLLPYFDVDPANPDASRTVLTVGNRATTATLANVVLWTDRGVPTYRFNVRLPANGVAEIDLGEIFANGTLPQSAATGFASCAATLPPAPLDAATLAGLRNAHSGQASTLLGGQCGSTSLGDTHARGYATIDVVADCASLVPGDSGYFVQGGTGVARNANVLWGEQSTHNTATGTAIGDALVAIEADGANAATTGASYTFYGRRLGSSADNRERLPTRWMGRYSLADSIFRTQAQVWRDPGQAAAFACATPPAGLQQYEVVVFDHQEEVSFDGQGTYLPLAAQSVNLADTAQASIPYTQGFLAYNLNFPGPVPPFGQDNQSHVSHVYSALTGDSGKSTVWPVPLSVNLNVQQRLCSDGLDNDGDGFVDWPNDPGCFGPNDTSEGSACSDGVDNDGDGLVDYPADPGCGAPSWDSENPECSDGIDNDGDGQTDYPNDAQCTSAHDRMENFDSVCDDGIDNDHDGYTDWPADSLCNYPGGTRENYGQCDDGVDNDGDGLVDYPNDPDCFSQSDQTEAPPQCSDGVDNDGDGLVDFPADPGCVSANSNNESPQCSDGTDNDGDGLVDFPNDPGCTGPSDPQEGGNVCGDGVDNDGDGLIDFPNDPGCVDEYSNTESPRCNDGIDNDGDTLIDFPNDPGCAAAWSNNEQPACNDGVDNDGDGLIDFPTDPGCPSASATDEATPQCSDGRDNDGNGLIDFPLDPNCSDPYDDAEQPACSDGVDNDGDGAIDYPADLGCASAADQLELDGGTVPQCADGIDNDGDGAIDWPADTGCSGSADDVEFAVAGGGGVAIVITPPTLPNGTAGFAYTPVTLTATGGLTPHTFAVTTGALPSGMTLTPDGTISGRPTINGSYAFTVTATDLNDFTGARDYVLVIGLPALAAPVPFASPATLALLLGLLALAAMLALRRRAA
jgi:hypothetical protein